MALVQSQASEAKASGARSSSGRRRYTAAEKCRLVEEASRPGASVSLVARRHGINTNLLFNWRRQVRRGTLAATVASPRAATPVFVPVGVVGGAERTGRVEIELPNGVRLQVEGAVERGRLVEVLAAVKAAW